MTATRQRGRATSSWRRRRHRRGRRRRRRPARPGRPRRPSPGRPGRCAGGPADDIALTLYLVRHADAGDPAAWTGNDADRPLSKKGRRQSKRLDDLLDQLGFVRTRCSHRHGSAPRIPRSCLAGESGGHGRLTGGSMRASTPRDSRRLSMSLIPRHPRSCLSATIPTSAGLPPGWSMPRWSCRRAPSSGSTGGSSGRARQRRAALADSAGRRPGLKPGNRDGPMERVLFLCTTARGRRWPRACCGHRSSDRYDVESAGVEATEVRPLAIRAMGGARDRHLRPDEQAPRWLRRRGIRPRHHGLRRGPGGLSVLPRRGDVALAVRRSGGRDGDRGGAPRGLPTRPGRDRRTDPRGAGQRAPEVGREVSSGAG